MTAISRHAEGLIHETYLVEAAASQQRFVLQRINDRVFPNIDALMDNIQRVIAHLKCKASLAGNDPARAVPALIRTRNGKTWYDSQEGAWRMMQYIPGTTTVNRISSATEAREIGLAFGRFLDDLADFPAPSLHAAVPGYRDTARYLASLEQAADTDGFHRADGCRNDIVFMQAHARDALRLQRLQQGGSLPIRAIHGDTKINNVLLDCQTKSGVCVIDLDTVMPGLFLHDLADCAREMLVNPPSSRMWFSDDELEQFESLVGGFMTSQSFPVSSVECENIVDAVESITLELGGRFLADYLSGDRYFKTTTDGQNLARARQHVALFKRLEANRQALNDRIRRIMNDLDT